jgi:ectoine hydroxylase-related dioxygenase (phytanoyl-CoA dioxygenase family)
MLTDEQVVEFDARGFLRGDVVLSAAEVETLRAELARVIANADGAEPQPVVLRDIGRGKGAQVWQIVNIWQASGPFRDLLFQPRITAEIAQLARARQVRLWHDQIQYKPAATGGVNMWHQDGPYWPILRPKDQVTAWIALDDVDEENGCMSMVPGSHAWGDQIQVLHNLKEFTDMTSERAGRAIEVAACPVRAGGVHYHHSLTWHGSPANASGRPRRAIALHYMPETTRYDASGTHLMKPFVEVADGAPLQGKAFPLVWDGGPVSAGAR